MTIAEIAIALGVSVFVVAGLLSMYVWSIRANEQSRMYAWAQMEALSNVQRISAYMRTATGVNRVDTNEGRWVELDMPDGVVSRFAYTNATGEAGAGEMLFFEDVESGSATSIVVRGLTEVMTSNSKPVFQLVGAENPADAPAIRMAFRITEPMRPGDAPVEVETSVYFRNR